MFRRMLCMLLMLLFALPVCGEEPPADIRKAASIEEAMTFLLFPEDEGLCGVERGKIRYISQDVLRDDTFRKGYWLGGEEGGDLDLTLKVNRYNHPYDYHVGVMCTRAAYCMALSYLGVDVTPGKMSELTQQRNLEQPYGEITELLGVELAVPRSRTFLTMMERYEADDSYSPIYIYLQKPNGAYHALVVLCALPETGRYLVADPNPLAAEGEIYRVYMISLNKNKNEIVNSTFRREMVGSKILRLYQWRLTDSQE